MVKYVTTAVALKCLSAGPLMRKFYRRLGNEVGNRRRGSGVMPEYYVDRVKRIVRLNRQFGLVGNGDRILELGTGWLHWEALTLRLLWDIESILFDVWDNRQLAGLRNYCRQLSPRLAECGLTAAELERARSILAAIDRVGSFEELYALLNFTYVVNAEGSLKQFADSSFKLVVSGGVLEHVHRTALPEMTRDTYRVLVPGGWAVHSIDTSDHLSHYDASVSKKKYLAYSEPTWKVLFENEVQYINRLQRGEWKQLFATAGFELVEEDTRQVDISRMKVAARYAHMDRRDLECTVLRFAFRKRHSAKVA
jgi:SAM-dependent methyltransferase